MKSNKRKEAMTGQNGKTLTKIGAFLGLILMTTVPVGAQCKIIKSEDVEAVRFVYLPLEDFNPNHSIEKCSHILRNQPPLLKDTIIMDRKVINRYVQLVNRLKPGKTDQNPDFRIASKIMFRGGGSVHVCYGDHRLIVYQGLFMKKEKAIFRFLDELLYRD